MTSGALDPTNTNMAAPLLAKSFSNTLFAVISAIAFTTVLGTVSGLIMAGSGAVAHDLLKNFFRVKMDDHQQVLCGKVAAAGLGVIAMGLGIVFQNFNVTFLVGWAFNIAASANLPALIMLLFWKRTTAKGIAAGITVGLAVVVGLDFAIAAVLQGCLPFGSGHFADSLLAAGAGHCATGLHHADRGFAADSAAHGELTLRRSPAAHFASIRYRCVSVRRMMPRPTIAGEAMIRPSSWLTASSLYSCPV